MTTFQLLAALVFGGTMLAAYGNDLRAWLKARGLGVNITKPPHRSADMVADMVQVAELRDRLAAIGCEDGVNACTLLLRVLVEYKYPQG